MAEIVGLVASSMTIMGLFKTCIDAFDLIQTSRHQELDLKKLTLRLNIEKCRLYTWGQVMGLTTGLVESSQQRPFDRCQFRDLVKDTLELIIRLFNDTHKIKAAYGCMPCTEQDSSRSCLAEAKESEPGPVEQLATSFANFKIGGNRRRRCSNIMQKAKWVVHDQKKFHGLIAEVKDLIDGLQDITKSIVTVANQNLVMRDGITHIRNAETLDLVAEVCEGDHPTLSDAASTRAETFSISTTVQKGIAAWTDGIEAGNAVDLESEDLESLTVTELKHRLLQLLVERQAAAVAQAAVIGGGYIPDRVLWLCKESRAAHSACPLVPLSACNPCRNHKRYDTKYDATSHLRDAHFCRHNELIEESCCREGHDKPTAATGTVEYFREYQPSRQRRR